MPIDWSLLHNSRMSSRCEYPIGVINHAESPTVAKRDNFEKSIYAGQLRNRLSRSLVVIKREIPEAAYAEELRRVTAWCRVTR
jgi:hypothetical protein